MESILQDIRQSFRTMREKLGFTLVVVLSLALGIGATTAIFSIVNNLLLRPLPFEDGERVVRVRDVLYKAGDEPRLVGMTASNFIALRNQTQSFADVGAQDYGSFNLVTTGQAERIEGAYITANVLPLLGIEPVLGRGFTPEEDRSGARARVVLLGNDVWRRLFGGDPQVLGRQIRLNDEQYTVIGVMPPAYKFPYDAELWVPIGLEASAAGPQHYLYTVARLKPGVSEEQAQRELDIIADRLAQEFPDTNAGWDFLIVPVREDLTEDMQSKLLVALLAASGFLLLIACANVANMMLARSLEQGRDIAIRAALGASRGRLVRQLVTHGLLLALLSGALGILLSRWISRPLVALSPMSGMSPFLQEVEMDHRILGFTLLVSLVVGVGFSLVPALKTSRPDLQRSLKEESRSTSSSGGRRLLNTFVVLEVALAVLLLIGAGLTIRSFQRLLQVEAGFPTENLLTLHVALPESKFPEHAQRLAFLDRALQQIRGLPGVTSADVTSTFVLDNARVASQLTLEDRPATGEDEVLMTNHRVVGPRYIETAGIPLLQGRRLTEQDRENGVPVVVVSRTFADTYWPGQNPLGKRVKRGGATSELPWLTVVGVVGDVIDNGDLEPSWYVPMAQGPFPFENVTLTVRTSTTPQSLVAPIREAVLSVDREQPIYDVATADEKILESYGEQRFSMFLFTMFAGLGLVLAMVGIYGILSYSVVQQRREMGLRMALGAQPGHILKTVLRQGLVLAVFGVAVGLVAAFILTRFLASMLHEISPTDPSTYLAIALISVAVALIASYLPARRATKVDPLTVLRY
jgi:putative ABC transport system permease protein